MSSHFSALHQVFQPNRENIRHYTRIEPSLLPRQEQFRALTVHEWQNAEENTWTLGRTRKGQVEKISC
jgi:hypothetical protein